MGSLSVRLCPMGTRAETGSTMPLAKSQPLAGKDVTTTTTAARVGTLAATDLNQVWILTNTGTVAEYVRMSADAEANDAGPDVGHVVPAGAAIPVGVTEVGEQVSARAAA